MCATDILQHCRSYMVYTASVSQQSYSVRTSRICQLGYADYATRVALLPQPFVAAICGDAVCCFYLLGALLLFRGLHANPALDNIAYNILYGMDRPVLWPQSRRQKALFLERHSISINWPSLAHALYLQKAGHPILN